VHPRVVVEAAGPIAAVGAVAGKGYPIAGSAGVDRACQSTMAVAEDIGYPCTGLGSAADTAVRTVLGGSPVGLAGLGSLAGSRGDHQAGWLIP